MRWMLHRGNDADDAPQLLTLADPSHDETIPQERIAALPGGALSITARSAQEAREALAELQRLQQELLTARARTAGQGVVTIGTSVTRQILRPGRRLRGVARGFRASAPARGARQTSGSVFDGLDAALLVAQTAGGIDDALKLVGSAIEAVGAFVTDIDLGDFDFD